MAARALGRAGLVHAYGHVSVRAGDGALVVNAPRPLGLVAPGEAGTACPIDGDLPPGVLGEVVIHQAIYKRRADVGAICRIQPPALMALGVAGRTPRALHGFSSYFAPGVPVHDDPQLVRDSATADRVAALLDQSRAVVLRGNGAVVVGASVEEAVVLSWYLEDSARLELAVASARLSAKELTAEQAARRATWSGGLVERMWQYLTAGDPEA